MSQTSDGRPVTRLGTGRLAGFSDGVFAVAITLLVLEISVPPGSADDLLGAIAEQWPSYLAYVVSFATVGAVWAGHVVVTEHLRHMTPVFIRLNLLLLLFVAFLPFPTRLLAGSVDDDGAGKIAATFYGLTLLAVATLLSLLWRYALRAQLVRPDAPEERLALLTRRLTPGLLTYVVMIGVGLLVPVVAVLGYLAVAVFYLIPVRQLRS